MPEPIAFTVNGAAKRVDAAPSASLLHALRNHLDLKGTRFGCGTEACGACMVLIDGAPRYACTTPLDAVAGKAVTTVEGLDEIDGRVKAAFLAENAGQCGYCLSGIMISASALLKRAPKPSRAEILTALDPHLCRCGAHDRIVRAVQKAAEMAS